MFFPVRPIGLYATYIFTPIGIIGLAGLYGYLIKKTAGNIRKKTIYALVGILFIFVGFTMDIDLVHGFLPLSEEVIGIIHYCLMMVGGGIYVQGYRE